MLDRTLFGFAVVFTLVGVRPLAAAEASGEAVSVSQTASADGASGSRIIEVKGPLFTGDVVKTDASGQVQVLFRDDTRLVVGPNSQVSLDSFVFQGPATAKMFSIDAVRGAFRFITGTSLKQAYSIKTPTATIGVRGTEFDVSITPDGATNLALFGGSVRVCDMARPNRHCAVIAGTCSVLILTADMRFRWVNSVSERTSMMDTIFPFAFRQQGLEADFRVDSRSCDIRDLSPPTSGSHNSPPPPPPPGPR